MHKLNSAFLMFTSLLQSSLYLLLRVLLLTLACYSSAMSAALTIRVVDEGDPVPMAEVILVNADSRNVIDNNFTDKNGIYHRSLEKGKFNVIISKKDFVDVHVKNIDVQEGADITKVIELMPRGLQSNETLLQSNSDDCD